MSYSIQGLVLLSTMNLDLPCSGVKIGPLLTKKYMDLCGV